MKPIVPHERWAAPKAFLFAAMGAWLVFAVNEARAADAPVTSAAFGARLVFPGMSGSTMYGDTWDGAWRANGELYLQHNDGVGFTGADYVHDRICKLAGTPELPSSLAGVNVNPGVAGGTLSGIPCYSTGLYDVDGVLYHNLCYSQQTPGAWVFHHTSTIKSLDNGTNWVNHLGQTNVLPPDTLEGCMFPSEDWGEVNFVKYGQGGTAPDVDRASEFVYLATSGAGGFKLARIPRTALPSLDRSQISYYMGGDGLLDVSWTNDITRAGVITSLPTSPTAMVYNEALGRYVMSSFSSDSWVQPPIESTLRIMEAPHPWGPWSLVLDENVNYREGDNLTWAFLLPKLTSGDGTKMWLSVSGRAPYGLQFLPVYLSKAPTQSREAEDSPNTGGVLATLKPGYSGTGYVGLDAIGDECRFSFQAPTAGGHIIRLRYNTSGYRNVGFFVNGQRRGSVKLGKSEQVYATWTDRSLLTWLESGTNTLAFRCEDASGAVNVDRVSLALYSTNRDSFPDDFAVIAKPYGGLNWSLPGRIEAENYDLGGEGIGYHDSDSVNQGGEYRSDGVDIQSSSDAGGGYQIGWTADGEWLQYTVDVQPGCYHFVARVASALTSPMKLGLRLDAELLGEVPMPGTGGWYNFINVAIPNVGITEGGLGRHLRLEIGGGGYNINWFSLQATNGMCAPKLNILGQGPNQITFRWQGIAGRSYALMASTNLLATGWQILTNLTITTNGPAAVCSPMASPQSYFKLGVQP